MIDKDCSIQAARHAFRASITASRLDVRRLISINFDDGARIAGQAGVTWIAVLAYIPIDNR
jgi:hypothetical protein